MAVINCKECGGKVSENADSCPHCGSQRDSKKEERGQIINGFLIICYLIFIFWFAQTVPINSKLLMVSLRTCKGQL